MICIQQKVGKKGFEEHKTNRWRYFRSQCGHSKFEPNILAQKVFFELKAHSATAERVLTRLEGRFIASPCNETKQILVGRSKCCRAIRAPTLQVKSEIKSVGGRPGSHKIDSNHPHL